MSKTPLSPREKALIMQTVTWVKTVNDAKPAGAPPSYPGPADIESSALFKRIRQGLPPMPWAPPTRHRLPAYELIENARGRHRVVPDPDGFHADAVTVEGASWRRLAGAPVDREQYLAFGRWPLAYRLSAEDAPRWPALPAEVDAGPGHEVVRFADGRLVPKELIRRTRDEVETQWWLQCVSPLNERLYLDGERLPLDDPDHFRPLLVHRQEAGRARVFACPLRQGLTVFFPLTTDPWTRVTRFLAVRSDVGQDPAQWLARFDAGDGPLDFLPQVDGWQVFELDGDGQPASAWRTTRHACLQPVAVTWP